MIKYNIYKYIQVIKQNIYKYININIQQNIYKYIIRYIKIKHKI